MKLGFDLDEIVVNMTAEMIKYLKYKYNIDWDISTAENYSIENIVFPIAKNASNEEIQAGLLEQVHDPLFQAKPYKNAVKYIKILKRNGHSINFISSRNIGAEYETAKWLRKHHILFDSIHHVGRQKEKGPLGRVLNLDFYMDDLETHLESMLKYKKRWRKGLALFTRPWNKDSMDSSKFIRLNNWIQVSRHLGIHKR